LLRKLEKRHEFTPKSRIALGGELVQNRSARMKMKSFFLLLCLVFTRLGVADDTLVRTSEPKTPEEEAAALSVPEGFEIQLFAAEPLINKPINLAHDDRGRLWVSSTVEYPYAAKRDRWSDEKGTRVKGSLDAIKIVEDTTGDGRADKVTDFADGLNIPTGVLPWHKPEHKDGCIAWSIPNIWYFADTTGDGKADLREVLFGPLGFERDTHGMCSSFRMGRDGWVYATHGFNNTSTLKGKDGTEVKLHSGNVFRFKPDGSSVEVFTRGQVNPFGLTFDRRGNLYSADCHSAPVYQLIQGAHYPSFGKPHDGLGFAPTMIEHTHGSTGICGITYIDRDQWGEDWNDHLLIGNPVTSRINHDRIEFHGTTPKAIEQTDFVTSKDPWFRPVDLCHGNDGALYVADFYNRIIGHYEVPLDHPGRDRERGRIWKITRKGKTQSPRELDPFVAIGDPMSALKNPSPFVVRRAAHQLQQEPDKAAIPILILASTLIPEEDTHLEHAMRIALRENLKLPGAFNVRPILPVTMDVLERIAPAVPTAASAEFLAISSVAYRHLTHIARYSEPAILKTLIEELRAESDFGKEVQLEVPDDLLRIEQLQTGLDQRGQLDPNPHLLAWAQDLATELLGQAATEESPDWIAGPHSANPKSESPWTHQKRTCTDGKEATVVSSLRIGEGKVEQRVGVLRSKEFSAPKSLSFWIVGHRGSPSQNAHKKSHVTLETAEGKELHRAYPPRSDIAHEVTWEIPESEIGKPVRLLVTDGDTAAAYAWLGITRIGGTKEISVSTFRRGSEIDQDLAKLAEMLKLTAPVALRDQLKPWLPIPVSAPAPKPVSKEERKRLDGLIAERVTAYGAAEKTGKLDKKTGGLVYEQNCAACHQIGGKGGLIGPQLDGVGSRGIARLAEDILDPNRNVDSHFYLTQFKMNDGTERSAFVLAEVGESLRVRDALGAQQRIPKASITSQETLPASLMPATFGESLSTEQPNNLIAWLTEYEE